MKIPVFPSKNISKNTRIFSFLQSELTILVSDPIIAVSLSRQLKITCLLVFIYSLTNFHCPVEVTCVKICTENINCNKMIVITY